MEVFNLPGFKKPVSRDEVIGVLQMFNYGDNRAFIAENCRISVKKVSSILESALPTEWVEYANNHPHGRQ